MLWTAGRSLPVRHCRVDSKFTSAFLIFNKVVSPPENLDAVDDRWFGFPQNVFQFALCRGNRSIETRVMRSPCCRLRQDSGKGRYSFTWVFWMSRICRVQDRGPIVASAYS